MTGEPDTHSTRFEPPRGMRDFYPGEMEKRNAIFDAWIGAARQFGFAQYDACVVESLDLLRRKGGEEIVEQIYTFKDKSGRELALRPEMTPSLARMIAARQGALAFPLKWFAIPQCFRYERMSRGRKREHFQWNLDIVGEPSVAAEAEVLACAFRALELMGLAPDVRVHYSSRALLSDLMLKLGIPRQEHAAAFLALDKRGKVDDAEISSLLLAGGMDAARAGAMFDILKIATLDDAVRLLGERTSSAQALESLSSLLDAHGLAGRARFDIGVVRGLGYYTGIVFEAFDLDRKFRAIFGGGRYDRLLQDVGGSAMTAVGLGFGDVVVGELLEDKGRLSAISRRADLAVGYMEDAQQEAAIRVASAFRRSGQCVDMSVRSEKAKAFFGRAGKGGARQAVYIGPDDVAKGEIRLKNLDDRSEQIRKMDALPG